MYEYMIYYRLDDGEYLETKDTILRADSIEELFDTIKRIESRNTIIKIENLSIGIFE